MYNEKKIRVCKKCFCSIFGTGATCVRTILHRHTSTGTSKNDRRGKQKVPRQKEKLVVQCICEHILTLPTPHRKYLSPDPTVVKLHDLYLEYMAVLHPGVEKVTESYYHNVFKTEFNIGFAPVKIDTCNTCDMLKAKIDTVSKETGKEDELRVLERKFMVHKNKQEKARNS